MIWIIKHKPNNDPKFHQIEIFKGVGKKIKDDLIILNKWFFLIIIFFIKLII